MIIRSIRKESMYLNLSTSLCFHMRPGETRTLPDDTPHFDVLMNYVCLGLIEMIADGTTAKVKKRRTIDDPWEPS